ncbi:RagB/SusD family nutrient uptake outer membrane protein [Salegentibacter sp. HM20]
MLNKSKSILILFLALGIVWGCEKDLELQPEDNRQTAESTFEDPESYKQFLAKLYAGLAVSGQQGPAGNPDLVGLDEGFSQYLRLYWMLQELTTEEAVIGWNDGTIKDLHAQNWTAGNEFIRTMYSRIMYQVALTNEYLRQTAPEVLESRGLTGENLARVQTYRAEARYLRALHYYHALDLFGNPPFVTEEDPIGAYLPEQIRRPQLFEFVESELLAIENEIPEVASQEYGRVNKAGVWMLLAKLYLNAEVYTGSSMYDQALTYSERVVNSGYNLVDDYQKLFLADNDINGAQNEIIFPITFDGQATQSYGGMSFIVHAAVGGDMDPEDFGVSSGWAGLRTTSTLVEYFPDEAESDDQRALFFTEGQTKEIRDLSSFTDGYAVAKYKNVRSDGQPWRDNTGEFVDIDFPLFRLADAYLMYAEAYIRGGGGSAEVATNLINELRERAYGDNSRNISSGDLTEDFILAERARELYWEAHRRTDRIRFGQFSDRGIWPWKGNVPQGATTGAHRDLMPIPATDLGVNTNLTQNDGY